MSALNTTLPPALAGLQQQALQTWQGRTRRERQALSLVAVVVAVFLVWMLFVRPAWSSVRDAPAQLDQLEVQLQQMQGLAAESRELRGTAPVSSAQSATALKAATDRLGAAAKITLLGDRATLTLTGASPEALRAWMSEARNAARARPVEAQLTRSGNGYSGSLSVSLPGAP